MQTRKRGTSLGEILLGVAILATVFLALIQIFPTAYAASDQSGDVVTATHLGQACMDRELNRKYEDLSNRPVTTETFQGTSSGASLARNYSVSVQVNRIDQDRTRITVSVQWKQRSQDLPRELRLQSTRVRP